MLFSFLIKPKNNYFLLLFSYSYIEKQNDGINTDPTNIGSIGAFGCLQTNTALPQLCNISWVSAETSSHKAQCIFALLCTAKNIISKHRKILRNIPFVCLTS